MNLDSNRALMTVQHPSLKNLKVKPKPFLFMLQNAGIKVEDTSPNGNVASNFSINTHMSFDFKNNFCKSILKFMSESSLFILHKDTCLRKLFLKITTDQKIKT